MAGAQKEREFSLVYSTERENSLWSGDQRKRERVLFGLEHRERKFSSVWGTERENSFWSAAQRERILFDLGHRERETILFGLGHKEREIIIIAPMALKFEDFCLNHLA